jgi:virulence-associated protein VagC
MATITKVFKSGGSQAVRIPRAFRLDTDTVTLDRTDGGLLIAAVSPAKGTTRGTSKSSGRRPRRPGFLKGIKVPADFDAPLPDSVLGSFGKA